MWTADLRVRGFNAGYKQEENPKRSPLLLVIFSTIRVAGGTSEQLRKIRKTPHRFFALLHVFRDWFYFLLHRSGYKCFGCTVKRLGIPAPIKPFVVP